MHVTTVKNSVSFFWNWVDNRKIVRRSCLYVAVWLNIDAFFWSQQAAAQDVDPVTIGVVSGIAAALLAAMVKFYTDSRNA